MRKALSITIEIVASALLFIAIYLLGSSVLVVFAETSKNTISNVSVTGEDIVDGNTYYLQWSNLSFIYNGNSQVPSVVLKCNEDESFEKTATVSVKNKTGEVVIAVNVGDYVAVAECDGINFSESENEKDFSISPLSVAVEWSNTTGFTYNGNAQGPTASYTINGNKQSLTPSGWGTNVGTYTASVTADAAGRNYTLTNLTCGYEIGKLSVAVEWNNTTGFTYNGNAQGPTASYTVNGNKQSLTPSGWGTNAGTYTASVTADAAGSNYTLTNLMCGYEIGQLAGKVLWVVSDNYVANGQAQGPRAFVVGVNGNFIELPTMDLGVKAGKYTAKIDSSKVNSNIELLGELSQDFKIDSEKQLGPAGVVFLVLFVCGVVGIVCWILYQILYSHKKQGDKIRDRKRDTVLKLQTTIDEKEKNIAELQYNIRILQDNIDPIQRELTGAKTELSQLKRELTATRKRLSEAEQRAAVGSSAEKELIEELTSQVQTLTEQIQNLSEENKKFRIKKLQEPDFYKRPIEDYFPEIDEAYVRAKQCDYDSENPRGSYYSQRQELDEIMKLIAVYRSQRR